MGRQPAQEVQVVDMGNGFRVEALTRCVGLDDFWSNVWHQELFVDRGDAMDLAGKVIGRGSIDIAHWTQRPNPKQAPRPASGKQRWFD